MFLTVWKTLALSALEASESLPSLPFPFFLCFPFTYKLFRFLCHLKPNKLHASLNKIKCVPYKKLAVGKLRGDLMLNI